MKKRTGGIISFLVLLVVSGCATIPSGPSVLALPGAGKTFEEFQADDAVCRQWAQQQLGTQPQETVNKSTAAGAVTGTVLGAGTGALLGAASGHPGAGAAIGAGSGLLLGTASGASAGNVSGAEAQRRYDNTYVQCMYAKGNQVPVARQYRRIQRSVPPPPDLNAEPPDYAPDNAYPAQ